MCTAFRSAAAPSSEGWPCSGRKACAHALSALHFSAPARCDMANAAQAQSARAGAPDHPNTNASPPDIIANQYAQSLPLPRAHTASCWSCTPSACHPAGRQSGPAQPVPRRSGRPPAGQSPHTLPIVSVGTLSATRLMRRALGTSSSSKGACTKKSHEDGGAQARPAYATCNHIRNCVRNCKLTGQTGKSRRRGRCQHGRKRSCASLRL